MLAFSLRAASLSGAGALLIMPGSPETLALWGLLATSVAGLIKGELDKRSERQNREQQHRFEMDERAATARALAENTALTRANGAKADAAYDVGAQSLAAANSVNEKIESAVAAIAKARE